MDPNYFSYRSDHANGDSFQNLSESDYAKVIFCDLYYNNDSTVGCRFQITDHVHEDPCDYIGLFRVGYDNLSQCLASKMLSKTDCEEDGKLLRCTFKPSELPELENGFYQFLYVTRDNEVCGASMPFEVKNSMKKDLCSDDDIVADNTEDDFMLVRSNMAEKNRRLQELLDEMTQKLLFHEFQMKDVQQKLKIVNEEKLKLENLLKKAREENKILFNEAAKITEDKNVICAEKEEAIRILKEKNKVFSSMFDNYSEKLKEFTELKDALEADKDLVKAENKKLSDRIFKLKKELAEEKFKLQCEEESNEELRQKLKKETSVLYTQLDDSQLLIEVLEETKSRCKKDLSSLNDKFAKLQEKMRDVKCENLALSTHLGETLIALDKVKAEKDNLLSELMALKFHVIDMHDSRHSGVKCEKVSSAGSSQISQSDNKSSNSSEDHSEVKCEKVSRAGSSQISQIDNKSSNSSEECDVSKDLFQEMTHAIAVTMQAQQTEMTNQMKIMKKRCEEFDAHLKVGLEKMPVSSKSETVHEELKNLKILCEEKDATIEKLKEELVKANGVVEYLTKERESLQNNESTKQKALDECILRLNEASEIYKKQFRKIEKLKKKLNKSTGDFLESSSNLSQKDSCSMIDSADEVASTALQVPQNQSSDSDTGEHVVGRPNEVGKMENTFAYKMESLFFDQSSVSSSASCSKPSTPEVREVPGLQTLIEMNLEKLKHSKSKDDTDGMFSIPCPVCDQDIGIRSTSSDELLKHLEMQHKQQICPVCGRLFDMTLPAKYFIFHVEDHFKANKK